MTRSSDIPAFAAHYEEIGRKVREDAQKRIDAKSAAAIPPSVHEIALEQGWEELERSCCGCDIPNQRRPFWHLAGEELCDHCLAVRIRAEVAAAASVKAGLEKLGFREAAEHEVTEGAVETGVTVDELNAGFLRLVDRIVELEAYKDMFVMDLRGIKRESAKLDAEVKTILSFMKIVIP